MYHRFKWTPVSRRRNWISQEYEPLQPYYLLQLSQTISAKTFVDVGANIGMYSIIMSQSTEHIRSYEANHALVVEIRKNFSLNDIKGSIRQAAVSNNLGKVRFGIVSRYAGNSAVVTEECSERKFISEYIVDSVRLDDDLTEIESPIVFKIDVEGHELSVLEGARRTLQENNCVIQIENFQDRVNNFMNELGYYKITSIGPDTYFSNIMGLDPVEIYEKSAVSMIEASHENKSMRFGLSDIALVISGRVYEAARKLARTVRGAKR